jgi:hypothetical protein
MSWLYMLGHVFCVMSSPNRAMVAWYDSCRNWKLLQSWPATSRDTKFLYAAPFRCLPPEEEETAALAESACLASGITNIRVARLDLNIDKGR